MTVRPANIASGASPAAQQQTPLISICIPTFNRASFLEKAIESILPQISSDTELLVYDTGSADHTQDVMNEVARKFPNARYFRLETRLGVDETLLLLLAESRGEYVWYFGSDDVLKQGAVQSIRERILRSAERPTLVYVNHDIVDIEGRLLIASQVGTRSDREYPEGWRAVPWLGMNLGYISSCILRRERALGVRDASDFVGSRWVSFHLYLRSLLAGGSLQYIGRPLIEARRNASACAEYAEVFVRQADRVLSDARRRGYPWHTILRTRDRICRDHYLRFVLSWRCDNSQELARTFPEIFHAFWMCPSFWLLLLPVRLAPPPLARAIRNRLRQRRARRNETQFPGQIKADAAQKIVISDSGNVFRRPFRALLLARKLIAAWGIDRFLKPIPLLVRAYRGLYSRFRPDETIRTKLNGHTIYLDPRDLEITRRMLGLKSWEPFETEVFTRVLESGMVVVDIGANIGHYTLEAARRVGEKGKVYAFEPEPRNFGLLCQNIEANRYRNVTAVRKALSDRCGAARLALSPDNFGGHHLENSAATGDCVEVETLTLDAHFGAMPGKVNVIKMDAEGAEMSILEGMRGVLDANPDLILFTEFAPAAIRDAGHDPERFLETLVASGFRLGIVNQQKDRIEALSTGHLEAFINSLLDEKNGEFYVNLLCLRGKAVRGPFGLDEWWHGAGSHTGSARGTKRIDRAVKEML